MTLNVMGYKYILNFTCFLFFSFYISAQELQFNQISTNQGLSQGTVNCIIKDSQGFIWIGTNDGLNKYDGYEFKIYRHAFQDSTTLSSNKIYDLVEDNQGNLWIATRSGLNVYLRDRDYFVRYLASQPENGLAHNFIRSLYKDSIGNIWIGTLGGGIFRFSGDDPANAKFAKIIPVFDPLDVKSRSISNITSIHQSKDKTLLIGSHSESILALDPVTLEANIISFDDNKDCSFDKLGKTIFEDKDGDIWILSEGNGFLIYNPATGKF